MSILANLLLKIRTWIFGPPDDGGIWCIVANVADVQLFGENHEVKHGTRHFSAGTKVYCYHALWGDGYERVKVIGRHRGSRRMVTMIISAKRLTNWRVKRVYQPYVVSQMKGHWDGSRASKKQAESIVESVINNAAKGG